MPHHPIRIIVGTPTRFTATKQLADTFYQTYLSQYDIYSWEILDNNLILYPEDIDSISEKDTFEFIRLWGLFLIDNGAFKSINIKSTSTKQIKLSNLDIINMLQSHVGSTQIIPLDAQIVFNTPVEDFTANDNGDVYVTINWTESN